MELPPIGFLRSSFWQRLAALNHRPSRLHESVLPNRQVRAVGRRMNRSEAAYLFGIGLFSSNVTPEHGRFHR